MNDVKLRTERKEFLQSVTPTCQYSLPFVRFFFFPEHALRFARMAPGNNDSKQRPHKIIMKGLSNDEKKKPTMVTGNENSGKRHFICYYFAFIPIRLT